MTWKKSAFSSQESRRGIQDFQLLNDRNVYENLSFVLKATGWEDKKSDR
jgi:cell division transport system ATP-binding protein